MLPIESTDEDFALRIFSTLNDRGLPLSDADIFKAKCYGLIRDKDEKESFVKQWKKIEDEAEDAKVGLQSLFYYYMFFLRAEKDDKKTTTIGLRKYYSSNEYEALKNKELISRLNTILDLWKVVNQRIVLENETWTSNFEILKMLDMLSSYTNDFWKYPVSIFYLKYHSEEKFDELFLSFLQKLAVKLFKYYVEVPTISHVKAEILKLDIEILSSSKPSFDAFKNEIDINNEVFRTKIITQNNKQFLRMLLKAVAYANPEQVSLLPSYWEIEHIFPQIWDEHIYLAPDCGYNADHVYKMIEHLGNKVPFEKVLNIKASNGYFSKKKEEYIQSGIKDVIALANSNSDWTLDSINTRDVKVVQALSECFDKWEKQYAPQEAEETSEINNPLYEKYKAMLDNGTISKEAFDELVKDL